MGVDERELWGLVPSCKTLGWDGMVVLDQLQNLADYLPGIVVFGAQRKTSCENIQDAIFSPPPLLPLLTPELCDSSHAMEVSAFLPIDRS